MKNKWFLFALCWFVASVYALIFHNGNNTFAPPFPHFDKLVHGLLFFVQIWLLAKSYLHEKRPIPLLGLWLFALVCAIASEWAQGAFTQTRQADFFDAVADVLGASVALWLAQNIAKIRYLKNN